MLVLLCGLLAIGSVFGQNEKLDYSGMKGPMEIDNNNEWTPPAFETRMNQASHEQGVLPGKRRTTCECGKANKQAGRIIGGTKTAPNEYPFLVGISMGNNPTRPHCGGTIISPRHVVTAAHCTEGARSLAVTMGEHDRSGRQRTQTIIRVNKIMDHEGYNRVNLQNDISLLLLEKPIKLSQTVGMACLPTPGTNLVGQNIRVVGWGAERFQGPMTNLPQKVDIRVIDMTTCSRIWQGFVRASPAMQICTYSGKKTACQGDSGGPVVWLDPETNRYTLVGAVSFGPHCTDSRPSVQSSVIHYLPWIRSKIQGSAPSEKTCTKL